MSLARRQFTRWTGYKLMVKSGTSHALDVNTARKLLGKKESDSFYFSSCLVSSQAW